MKNLGKTCFAVLGILLFSSVARADEVAAWNEMMFRAGLVGATSPLNMGRVAAIVSASVFDAVNGIDRQYTPVHVAPAGPAGASRDAAAAMAAYTALVALYPTQKTVLDARLATSLAAINARETPAAVAAGLAWGQTAANGILSWRATDGFTPNPPPFTGSTAVGKWRPTPPAFAPGAGPQYAYMTPWVIATPDQFLPPGPPALTSARYTQDFNETKTMGSATSTLRTPEQTIYAWFWAASTASYIWNTAATSLMDRTGKAIDAFSDHPGKSTNHLSSLERARLLALLNLAMADAGIGCWNAKYNVNFQFWRPVTAIPLAATDGNPATTEDASWVPLFATPAHPEYPSGHSCVSGAAGAVLADFFGEKTHFEAQNDLMPGIVRSYSSFTEALDEVKNARIFAGIHFRSATDDGQTLGRAVADYVLTNALQPVGGKH